MSHPIKQLAVLVNLAVGYFHSRLRYINVLVVNSKPTENQHQ